ncbi:MAG: septum formation protein Maf [Alphaproteobacteria bacterium]|nr:septum formation protein Maf [Alphaproteobacteria bacterium]
MTNSASSSTPKVILASASQSRARLLKEAGVPYTAEPAYIDEGSIKESLQAEGADALSVAETLAELKAVKISRSNPQALVIGADSILDLDGVWFDKPADLEHAKAHLMTLRGRTHCLATAVVVALGGSRIWHFRDQPNLTMRSFSDAYLEQYVANVGDALLSSVGAYHLEGLGVQLFDRIDGDFFSILGLPLLPLLSFLREHQVVVP